MGLGRAAYFFTDALNLGVLRVAIFVDLPDAAARQNIVELVEQREPPGVIQQLLIAGTALQTGPGVEPFGLAQQKFGGAISFLSTALAGVRAAMVFQVQFANPRRQLRIVPHAIIQALEEAIDAAQLHLWIFGQVAE